MQGLPLRPVASTPPPFPRSPHPLPTPSNGSHQSLPPSTSRLTLAPKTSASGDGLASPGVLKPTDSSSRLSLSPATARKQEESSRSGPWNRDTSRYDRAGSVDSTRETRANQKFRRDRTPEERRPYRGDEVPSTGRSHEFDRKERPSGRDRSRERYREREREQDRYRTDRIRPSTYDDYPPRHSRGERDQEREDRHARASRNDGLDYEGQETSGAAPSSRRTIDRSGPSRYRERSPKEEDRGESDPSAGRKEDEQGRKASRSSRKGASLAREKTEAEEDREVRKASGSSSKYGVTFDGGRDASKALMEGEVMDSSIKHASAQNLAADRTDSRLQKKASGSSIRSRRERSPSGPAEHSKTDGDSIDKHKEDKRVMRHDARRRQRAGSSGSNSSSDAQRVRRDRRRSDVTPPPRDPPASAGPRRPMPYRERVEVDSYVPNRNGGDRSTYDRYDRDDRDGNRWNYPPRRDPRASDSYYGSSKEHNVYAYRDREPLSRRSRYDDHPDDRRRLEGERDHGEDRRQNRHDNSRNGHHAETKPRYKNRSPPGSARIRETVDAEPRAAPPAAIPARAEEDYEEGELPPSATFAPDDPAYAESSQHKRKAPEDTGFRLQLGEPLQKRARPPHLEELHRLGFDGEGDDDLSQGENEGDAARSSPDNIIAHPTPPSPAPPPFPPPPPPPSPPPGLEHGVIPTQRASRTADAEDVEMGSPADTVPAILDDQRQKRRGILAAADMAVDSPEIIARPTDSPDLLDAPISSIARAVTPNANLAHRTPAGSQTPDCPSHIAVDIPQLRKHKKVDRGRELVAYARKFSGISRLSDYTKPANDKEATLGKGTFGVVTKATRNSDKQVVALKLLQTPPEEGSDRRSRGVLGTTLREIKILKLLDHENVVPLLDIVVDYDTVARKRQTFLVFPYMDHDLCGLLRNPELHMNHSLLKLYMLQLLEGLAYMHGNLIVHRDLKTANLLINNQGLLQIADFGLARSILAPSTEDVDDARYTNLVVTRWYRAPELFMGEDVYGPEVDMWSVGCILGEMFTKRVLIQGTCDIKQLGAIFELCGGPPADWERYRTVLCKRDVTNDDQKVDPRKTIPVKEVVGQHLKTRLLQGDTRFSEATKSYTDLLDRLLQINPSKRLTALQAIDDRYFWEKPAMARDKVQQLEPSKERRDQQEEEEARYLDKKAAHEQQRQTAASYNFAVAQHNATTTAFNNMAVATGHPPPYPGHGMVPGGVGMAPMITAYAGGTMGGYAHGGSMGNGYSHPRPQAQPYSSPMPNGSHGVSGGGYQSSAQRPGRVAGPAGMILGGNQSRPTGPAGIALGGNQPRPAGPAGMVFGGNARGGGSARLPPRAGPYTGSGQGGGYGSGQGGYQR